MGKYLDELITKKIEEIKKKDNTFAIGKVIAVKEYIVEVSGLDEACFMEKIIVSGNSTGYVCSIGMHSCKVAIVERNDDIYVGDDAVASGELFKGLYSTDSVGHIIDIFGHDRVTGSSFDNIHEIEVEKKNVPLMDRSAVVRPLETGIAGIDLIYPIGKGQRQLILGDKKTGKTQLCLDTIVNQKDKKVLCIYVAIGKTKKNIVNLYDELSRKGAMEHTIIVAAFNDDPSPLLFLTPYVALSIAEEYMMFGMDVLVVIDDLKRHANIHREMSLLVGKAPGREAYPADIFYTHSRLLEKGCQHKNGGSITILPIVETKGGDATSYIPTNIISITDGQLILSAGSFQKGQKPAIDYGLSVSRLGGAVQLPEIKKLGAVVRRELLSYLETRKVYELANEDEMSDELKSRLRKGRAILDDLNQYKYSPKTKEEIIETFSKDVNGVF